MIGNEAAARAFEQEFAGKIFRYVNLETRCRSCRRSAWSPTPTTTVRARSPWRRSGRASAIDGAQAVGRVGRGAVARGQPDRSALERRPGPDLRPLHRPLSGAGEGEMRIEAVIREAPADAQAAAVLKPCPRTRTSLNHPHPDPSRPSGRESIPCASIRLRCCERPSMKNRGHREARPVLPRQGIRPGDTEGRRGARTLRLEAI